MKGETYEWRRICEAHRKGILKTTTRFVTVLVWKGHVYMHPHGGDFWHFVHLDSPANCAREVVRLLRWHFPSIRGVTFCKEKAICDQSGYRVAA